MQTVSEEICSTVDEEECREVVEQVCREVQDQQCVTEQVGEGWGGGDRRNRKGVGAEEKGQVHEEGNRSRRKGARTICCRSLIQVEECNTVNDLQCESQQDEECEDVSNLPSTALHYTT